MSVIGTLCLLFTCNISLPQFILIIKKRNTEEFQPCTTGCGCNPVPLITRTNTCRSGKTIQKGTVLGPQNIRHLSPNSVLCYRERPKGSGCGFGHSSFTSDEVKNAWRYTSIFHAPSGRRETTNTRKTGYSQNIHRRTPACPKGLSLNA